MTVQPSPLDLSAAIPLQVAHQAERTPQACAVSTADRQVSYAELDAHANQMAHHLLGLGVGPETFVGVGLPRGIDLVTTLLALWRVGAAYLPLDPDHPPRRLAWMLADTGARVVVSDERLAIALGKSGAHFVVPNRVRDEVAALPRTTPSPGPDRSVGQAAYAIYTSGSTGTPKGVVVTNEGITNRIRWVVQTHGLSCHDRVLQKTPLTFDAACWEIFAPLVSGGTVVLAPPGAEGDPAAVVRQVVEDRITVLQVVPSLLRMLVDEPGLAASQTLRLVFSAGETLHAELVHRLLDLIDVEVWNTYGPTECSIDVTAHRFDPQQRSGPVPIGRPIDGMRVLILDEGGNPAPIGARGELYVGGVGVARGYLGQAARTAESFRPDPYGPPGSRLYRTGDLVRWRPEGTLDYRGRTDDQAKVNGVRVEPGEVEAALTSHPDVRGAVVTAFRADDGVTRLAAYVHGRREGVGDLREFLRGRLPASHVPAVFVDVDSFPVTSSGKVDRAALPRPAIGGGPARIRPRTDEERVVAGIWQELLGARDVGVTDDFFRLGGTSLQLTRLANRLRTASGRRIELAGLLEAPTVERQARLLAGGAGPAGGGGVRPVSRDGGLPLSYGQHRLWFLDQISPHRMEWGAALFLRVPADVPVGTVRWALDALRARHESLRTRFVAGQGEPEQVVDPPAPVELRQADGTDDELAALLREESERGFDLQRGPLVRALLAGTEGSERTLVLTMHHIVCDGWSSAVLDREFHELLDARRAGVEARLPDLAVQYADYAVWQRERLTDSFVEAELRHWRGVLAGLTPLPLRTDRPRPAVRDARGGLVGFTVPAPLATAVTDLGQQRAAAPFVTLLTAFATLLARYTGQWDVPVGTPVAGRDRPELEGVVGFFLNNLVARCELDGSLTFGEALDRVKRTVQDALAHQDLPFERLVADLAPERDLSRTPLYQVAFDLHDEKLTGSAAESADVRLLHDAWQVAKTDLTLFVRRQPDGSFAGGFEYARALFDEQTLARMSSHYLGLLAAVVEDPDVRLDTVEFLPPDEGRALAGWSRTVGPPTPPCVHEAFQAQVALTPDAAAVVCDGQTVTYAELDRRANRLAHHLRGSGTGPESVVAVLADRGADLIAALLAAWKAGAAYLPLDQGYPADRISAILEDAGATVVVTEAAYASRFTRAPRDGLVLLDDDAARIATAPDVSPGLSADPDRLAYLIFTSGSTGRPKGVQITHAALANHVGWAARELAACGVGGAALFSSVAFDLVVPNIWAPLVVGQPVTVLPQDLDLGHLGDRLLGHGPFSFLKLTPAHLRILSEQVPPERGDDLAAVIVAAGEALAGRVANPWVGRLINEYGPTETTVGACTYPVTEPVGGEVTPIGRPLPNVALHVLDRRLRPVPIGVTGELCVGGAGVARGYANQPGPTAASFVPDPFGAPGSRLYRTGDVARMRPDGNIEFVGRLDEQVQVRGYRIEPGEIEAVLTAHPAVRDARVVADDSGPGGTRLVAYVVPADAPHEAELTAYCAAALPEYMVPSFVVPLEAIPLTANGKLDRAALPVPGLGSGGDRVAPRTVAEERIAGIWAGLLGADFGVHDNFFKAGGNSILAIRLIADIQSSFEIDLPVRVIFEGPTVAEMAAAVEQRIRAEIDQMSEADLIADLTSSEEPNR